MLAKKNFFYVLMFLFPVCLYSKEDSAKIFQEIKNLSISSTKHGSLSDSSFTYLLNKVEKVNGLPIAKTKAFKALGNLKEQYGVFDDAQELFEKALHLSLQTNNYLLIVKSYAKLAENQLDQNNFEKAIELGLKALNVSEKSSCQHCLAVSQSSLAESYRHYGKMKLAEDYNIKAIANYRAIQNWDQLARCYNNLAATIGKKGRNQEAIDTLKNALKYVDKKNYFARGKQFSNIAYCFRNMAKFDSALVYNRISLQYKRKVADKWGISYSLGAIGRSYIGLGVYDSAIYYTLQSYDTALKYASIYRIKDAAHYVSDAYRAAGKFEQALHYLEVFMNYDDSIFVSEENEAIEKLQRKFDYAKKEAELEQFKSAQKLKEANQKNVVATLIGFVLLLFVLVLSFRLIARKRAEEKKQAEIALKNSIKELELHKSELKNYTQELVEKNKSLKQFQTKIIEKEAELEKIKNQKSEELEQLADLRILTDEDWKRFKVLFERVHPQFFQKLNLSIIGFTKGEKRLLALTKLSLEQAEIADVLGISTESVTKSRFRLKKKLKAEGFENIEEFLLKL